MKTMYQKILLICLLPMALQLGAAAQSHVNESHISSKWQGNAYTLTLNNDQLTELTINGKTIPSTQWNRYKNGVDHFKGQLKLEQAQAKRDQAQALLDQQQAGRDQEQALKDQEQARQDQQQALKDQEQARQDQKMYVQLTADLVSDHIIPDKQSLHELQFNSDGLFVNGVKQPDSVYKKYKEKYAKISGSSFSYSK